MVTFHLIHKDEHKLEYAYYPEGHEDKKAGILVVDFSLQIIYVKKLAEEESGNEHYRAGKPGWYRECLSEERRKHHQPLLAENDWPSKRQSLSHYAYARFAILALIRCHNRGKMPEDGYNMWY